MTVAEKLDKNKAALLLLTGANPAINIKKYSTKGLEFNNTDTSAVLYHLLNEKSLKIKGQKSETITGEVIPAVTVDHPSAEQSGLRILYEKGDLNDLNKRAQKTREEAILFQEEQGVNILFLALGCLRWREDDKADKYWYSPLVLIPVKLGSEGPKKLLQNENWAISYTEEDIEPNHSLQESLVKQFGITLPEMPEWNELEGPEQFNTAWKDWISKIKETLAFQKDWETNDQQVLLSFFSFARYQMYKDLDSRKWYTEENPGGPVLLRKLLEDGDGFHNEKISFPEGIFFDKELHAEEPFAVMDLDSSQAEVLMEARHTGSMVVEGPPGTGKSATITNLIADAINSGRKVLFVAEKMAALEVVKDNLNKVNLGKFCLELHGNKTSKTAFLGDFKAILETRTEASLPTPFSKEKLNEARNELRQWSDLINLPSPLSGYTPYELFGLLMWSEVQLAESGIPLLQNLITNQRAFHDYAKTVTKSSLGYKQAGQQKEFIFERESEEIKKFQLTLAAVGEPALHPFAGTELTIRPSRSELAEIIMTAQSCNKPMEHLRETFTRFQIAVPWITTFTLNAIGKMIQALSLALQVKDVRIFALAGNKWMERETDVRNLIAAVDRAQKTKALHDHKLLSNAWSADMLQARTVLAVTNNNWFNRVFNSKYRAARKQVLGYFIHPQENKDADLLSISDDILSFQELTKVIDHNKLGQEILGSLWQGLSTDVTLISGAAEWGIMIQNKVQAGHLPKEIIAFLTAQKSLAKLQDQYDELTGVNNAFSRLFTVLREKIKLNATAAGQWKELDFEELQQHIINIAGQADTLADWISFYTKAQALKNNGKDWIVQVACNWDQAKEKLLYYVLFKVWEELLKNATIETPLLDRMERVELDNLRMKFILQDNLLKQYNQLQLIQKHNVAIKAFGSIGQPGFVRENLRRKRKIPAIRKFLSEAFDAIATIKPVFMMSPLSVAAYLEAKPGMFDLVIFDEASQIEPIDAFGAILRGKQVIVVGDTKQMPPTNFFRKMTGEDNDDGGNEQMADSESIMDLMISRRAKRKYLLWHYRSRHPSLIRISNTKFYDEKLLVYPGREISTNTFGLRLNKLSHLNCPYEGDGVNTGEAKAVAQAILRFSEERPHKNLGVVAFNIRQKEAIQKEVEQLAKIHRHLNEFINKEDKEGKKINFIKNLENVQGDERDVIFISIGYGMSPQGTPSYNFGPLNRIGGERRLNVLITRAREQNIVFANFSGNDLDPSRTKNEGVKILSQFLSYAETGIINTATPVELEADSVFEQQILTEIKAMGFEARTQVGSKGYRIDIAIIHPDNPDRFILAIECDGPAYHHSVSARDRDRLRQDILERGGWKFYRIWSSNWFRSRAQEHRKLKEAIMQAIRNSDQEDLKEDEPVKMLPQDNSAQMHISLSEQELLETDSSFIPYTLTSFPGWTRLGSLYDLNGPVLERYLLKTILTESPVHISQVISRIGDFQNAKITQKAKRHIQAHIDALIDTKKILIKGDFIWTTANNTVIVPRNFALVPDKHITLIAPEELDEAFKVLLGASFGTTENELFTALCKNLGFRKTDAIVAYLSAHFSSMTERNIIIENQGILRLK